MSEVINQIISSRWTTPVVIGIIGTGGGFAAGYILGKKKAVDAFLDEVHDNWVYPENDVDEGCEEEDEIAETIITITPDDISSEELTIVAPSLGEFTDYRSIVAEEGYDQEEETEESVESDAVDEPPPVAHNVFSGGTDMPIPEWDYNEQDRYRAQHPDGPYPIHEDEYARNDMAFHQETLTYYAVDDILADVTDEPVYKYNNLVGQLMFGFGSTDPQTFYVRNPGVRREWEILLHAGSYAEEVRGVQIEAEHEEQDLKHSAMRRFRDED